MFMTFVNSLAVVLITCTVLYELSCGKTNNVVYEQARHRPTGTSTEKCLCKGRYIDIMYMFMTFVNSLAVVLITCSVLYELSCGKTNNVVYEQARHRPTGTSTEKC